MIFEQEKATVPIPPVTADGEQSIQKNPKQSVSDDSDKINDGDYDFEKIRRQLQQQCSWTTTIISQLNKDRYTPDTQKPFIATFTIVDSRSPIPK